MKRIWIILLAIAVALAIALPAGAKNPNKPPKPDGGFRPIACDIDIVLPPTQVTPLGGLTVAYTVDPTAAYEGALSTDDILCAEVRVSGTLSDLRVRWLDYLTNAEGGCELTWARGKELRRINNDDGAVFAVGLSLEGWEPTGGLCGAQYEATLGDGGNMTVVVMAAAKTANTSVAVTVGIDDPKVP